MINKLLSDTGDYLISAAPAADPRWGGSDANLPVTLGLKLIFFGLNLSVSLLNHFVLR